MAQFKIASELSVYCTKQEEIIKDKTIKIVSQKREIKELRKTIKKLQNKLLTIDVGLNSIGNATEELKTESSLCVYPAMQFDQLKMLIVFTDTLVKQARSINNKDSDCQDLSQDLSDIVDNL